MTKLAVSFALIIGICASVHGCAKSKSDTTRAECRALTEAASAAPGAIRDVAGASREMIAARLESAQTQIAGVPLTDSKLIDVQNEYVTLMHAAAQVARDSSKKSGDFESWRKTFEVQESDLHRRLDATCATP
jgi:hypothetical protein